MSITMKKVPLPKRIWKDRWLLLLFLPCLIYYILFKYVPMWGVLVAFKEFKPFIGFGGSDWVGLKHFVNFFTSPNAYRIIRNTVLLGLESLLFSFPFPIVFALVLNEVKHAKFKKIAQTISYLPHFLSVVVVCGMVSSFLSPVRGPINMIIENLGGEKLDFLSKTVYFRPIYIITEIWQATGWGAIIYLAAISNIDPSYYEAAKMDGASRGKQIWYITLPCISSTVITMLILRIGNFMAIGLEKTLLLQSPATYETSDIIATYVYRMGIGGGGAGVNLSYSAAVGLFEALVNLVLLVTANTISKKVSDTGLF